MAVTQCALVLALSLGACSQTPKPVVTEPPPAHVLDDTPPHREPPRKPQVRGVRFVADWAYWLPRIIQCESRGDPTADNPTSSASGLGGILDSTWSGHGNFARAKDAPPSIQVEKMELLYVSARARGGSGLEPWLADPKARACLLGKS